MISIIINSKNTLQYFFLLKIKYYFLVFLKIKSITSMSSNPFEKSIGEAPNLIKSLPIQIKPLATTFSPSPSSEIFFPNNNNSSMSLQEIKEIKEKNKSYYKEYTKLLEKNKFLKYKLEEVLQEKKKCKKCLYKLEKTNTMSNDNENKNEYKDKLSDNNEKNVNIINKNADNNNEGLIKNEFEEIINHKYMNKKRKRRKKSQLKFGYICNYEGCDKKYATEGSLHQHIKLKHNNNNNCNSEH